MGATIVPIIHQQHVVRAATNGTKQTVKCPLLSQAQGTQSDAGKVRLKTHEGQGSPISLQQ